MSIKVPATLKHAILCEQCACYFEFPASRKNVEKLAQSVEYGMVSNTSPENLRAVIRQLKQNMAKQAPQYCPQCGWMQRSMIPAARKRYRRWMYYLAIVSLPVAFLALMVGSIIAGPHATTSFTIGFTILGIVLVAAPLLAVVRWYTASRFDPNILDVQTRISVGKKTSTILSAASLDSDNVHIASTTKNDLLSQSTRLLNETKPKKLQPNFDPKGFDNEPTSPYASQVNQPKQQSDESSSEAESILEISGYRIQGEIARGGMGVIYAARDIALDRDVVIKLPLLSKTNVEKVISRFKSEARITAKLPHPGVPPVHTSGTLPDSRPYLVMKLIRGSTLADLLRKRKLPNQDLDRFLLIFQQVADTVGFAHRVDIIHRDLKPNNIMVGSFGEVQVMDWGLAREGSVGSEKPESDDQKSTQYHESLTQTGDVLGTLSYMAPEQARGEYVTSRADVFALGAILVEILTGAPLYLRQHGMNLWEMVCTGETSSVLQRLQALRIDPDLITLTMRCLEVDADKRPGSASEVAMVIEAYRRRGLDNQRDELILQAVNDAQHIRDAANQKVTGVMGFGQKVGAFIAAIAFVAGGIAKCVDQTKRDNHQRSYGIQLPAYTAPVTFRSSTQPVPKISVSAKENH